MPTPPIPPSITEALADIEPYSGLGMEVLDCSPTSASLSIALDGNRNDKDTMFAGSIYSAMILVGWTLARAATLDIEPDTNVVIAKSESRFLRPIHSDSIATARATSTLEKRKDGKHSLAVTVEIHDADGQKCAEFDGLYIILPKP